VELTDFCSSSRVIIVAGKGGVGKTTVSAALSVAAARAGRSVLLIELEQKSNLGATFDVHIPSSGEVEAYSGVTVMHLAPDEALLEYLESHGLWRVSKKLMSSGALDVFSTAVPGMKDILVLGKVKALQRAGAADVIVVDGPATGHAVSFLLSSRGLLDAVRVGPVLTQAVDVTEMLADPDRARILLVALAEETPVNETVEAVHALVTDAGLALGPVVVNGVYPDRADPLGVPQIRKLAAKAGVDLGAGEAEALAAAAAFGSRRRALQAEQLDRLAGAVEGVGTGLLTLPFLFRPELGPAEVETLAERLADGFARLEQPA
jgi:anion-transporting  ArsA/GET3 family ATPase